MNNKYINMTIDQLLFKAGQLKEHGLEKDAKMVYSLVDAMIQRDSSWYYSILSLFGKEYYV